MNDRVSQHERMRRYLQHRERVLEVKSVVNTGLSRSRSVGTPSNADRRKEEVRRKIETENRRLLQSLVKISEKPGQYSISRSRPASAQPRRQSTK